MEKNIVVYPISANPPTWGHADIVVRSSRMFDLVFWVAAVNREKTSIIPASIQTKMMQEYVDYYKLSNVKVDHFSGSLVRYALDNKARIILRGIRNSSDLQSEMELATGYRGVSSEVETICLFANPQNVMISSSLVRELARVGENIEKYVHPFVARELIKIL